jgi:uncharacterized membrane protein YdbT with pleckstrin-like domain
MAFKSFFKLFTQSPNSFIGQEKGEKIVLFIRRHPFLISLRIIGLVITYAVPVSFSTFFIDFILQYNFMVLYLFIISLWTLFIWMVVFYWLTMYTLDMWIITDRRIIDSNQHGFFNRTVAELHISRIQDIYVNTEGTFQTLINFGDLFVQTAGTEERFKFLQIPDPVRVKDVIMEMAFSEEHKEK